MRLTPVAQGLYDPRHEHDACGVGFVVDIEGRRSHDIVDMGLEVLLNMEHRGASGSEADTGDGAGMLLQIPHRFLKRECDGLGFELPEPGSYAVGMVFLPSERHGRRECEAVLESVLEQKGQQLLGWRSVPTDGSSIGPSARATQPVVRQVFVGRAQGSGESLAFERQLYAIRRLAEKAVRRSQLPDRELFYIPSLSSRTLVYKGMLNPSQITTFYPSSDARVRKGCLSQALRHPPEIFFRK